MLFRSIIVGGTTTFKGRVRSASRPGRGTRVRSRSNAVAAICSTWAEMDVRGGSNRADRGVLLKDATEICSGT